MTATVSVPSTRTPAAPAGVSWRRVHSGEWLALRGLRSTTGLLVALAVVLTGVGVVPALGVAVGALEADPADAGALGGLLTGIGIAEFLVAGFAVLAVTGEYGTGAVRATFTAVPRRGTVVTARAAVVAELVLGVAVVALGLGYAAVRLLLGSAGVHLSLATPGAARALVGAVLDLALLAVLGTGLGWLTRSTAGGLAAFVGVFHVLPLVRFVLPRSVGETVARYLPADAGNAMFQPDGGSSPWVGLAVFGGYAAVAVLAAVLVVRRRDA
jgi:ABC-2 type transport system permease protein